MNLSFYIYELKSQSQAGIGEGNVSGKCRLGLLMKLRFRYLPGATEGNSWKISVRIVGHWNRTLRNTTTELQRLGAGL